MNDKKDKKPLSKKVFWTRVMCIFLAVLMIGSLMFLAIQLIVEEIEQSKSNKVENYDPTIIEHLATESNNNYYI